MAGLSGKIEDELASRQMLIEQVGITDVSADELHLVFITAQVCAICSGSSGYTVNDHDFSAGLAQVAGQR
jgi:hypothetical protein